MLSDIYTLLREKDMLAGHWCKKSKYRETFTALSYEQYGRYEEAQNTYEQVSLPLYPSLYLSPRVLLPQSLPEYPYHCISPYEPHHFIDGKALL